MEQLSREIINSPKAPAAVGAYSHAVRSGQLLFCSGQVPLDPSSGELVGDSYAEQAQQCLENLTHVAQAGGGELSNAVRMTIYLTDMGKFEQVNEVYSRFFEVDPPARVTIGVAALPKGAQVEMDAVIALDR